CLGAESQAAAGLLQGEWIRYSDFLGFGNQKLPLPIRVPARGLIVLVIVSGAAVLYMRQRRVFWQLVLPTVAAVGWWLFLANKSVRYTAVAAPMFALIVAAAAVPFSPSPTPRRLAATVCLIYAPNPTAGHR